MSAVELQSLSQDELRKRLYQTFKNRGVLDTLKTQLRNLLICELKRPVSGGESASLEGDSLLFRASNSLVADHLRSAGYEYTLSVFYPECGLEKEKAFTVRDLLHLMKVNPHSRLFNSLTSNNEQEHRQGILLHVLMELTEYHQQKESRDVDTQTISTPLYKESVVEKLQQIDEQFADIFPKHHKFESLEGKLAVYRKEIEQQLHAEMSQKLQYFKDIEIAKIQLEEKEKWRKEMSDLRQELAKSYQMKSDGLITRERNAIERLQQHREIEAKEGYAQRQHLLKDIEMVRSRETHLKQRVEAFELAEKLQEEKIKSAEDALRRRELAVKNIEDTFDQKLKNEVLKCQIDLKEDYIKRTYKIAEDEKRNKEEAMRLREESIFVHSKKEEFDYAVSRAKDIEMELNSVKAQVSLVTRQNEALSEQLQGTRDYVQLKEEKLNLQIQMKRLNEQLEEIKVENQRLRDRIASPTTDELVLQAQVQRVENARKLDQDEFEAHKDILEKQLQREVALCAELKIQLLNSEDANRRINMQMEDVKLQLQRTQQGGVKNPRFQQPCVRRSSSPDSDIEFVATTKARIKELEKEADYLEEAYRNYQSRVIRAARKRSPEAKPTTPPFLRSVLSKAPSNFSHKVTFVEDAFTSPQQSFTQLTEERHDRIFVHDGGWTPGGTPLQKNMPSTRRHSSTPISKVDSNFSNKSFSEDTNGSYLGISTHSRHLSPIPKQRLTSSAASPPLHHTEAEPRDDGLTLSNHLHRADCQESNELSMPPKLELEDLSDASHQSQDAFPQQLESDVSLPSVKSDKGNPVTATLPAASTTSQLDFVIGEIPLETQNLEEEDKKWEEERREREERRQREREEAFERQQKELEQLEKERSLKEEDSLGNIENKDYLESEKIEGDILNREDVSAAPAPNPLEKYMQIILQNREQELADKSSRKDIVEDISLTERHSDDKDDSIAAISRGETDEDFW
ncbi:centriole and centriolar satellite protein OFD1 isoform X2 [Ambystoma mexicanum]|uniref:centriole and centriolar satellite protein OFD1 isoform X2 n=1 Tax=Ambystoma mexicanum TaxID=8296 RepID=UPI0037E88E28